MALQPLNLLNQELDTCRRRITQCVASLRGLNGEEINQAVNSFLDHTKRDIQALGFDGIIVQAGISYNSAPDQWPSYDLVHLYSVEPNFWGLSNFAIDQELGVFSLSNGQDLDTINSDRTDALRYSQAAPGSQMMSHSEPPTLPYTQTNAIPSRSVQSTSTHEMRLSVERSAEEEITPNRPTPRGSSGETNTSTILRERLSRALGQHFEEVANHAVFVDFCLAVQYIRCNDMPKLPTASSEISAIFAFLNRAQSTNRACHLYHRIGLWRLRQSYKSLQRDFQQRRETMTTREIREAREGKCSSQALDVLLQTSGSSLVLDNAHSAAEVDKLKIRMHRYLLFSRPWCLLGERFSAGILCLVPRAASSCLERASDDIINDFVQSLEQKRGDELRSLAMFLSPHFQAVLEGQQCLLGNMIDDGSCSSWIDMLSRHSQLSHCPHAENDMSTAL